MATNVNISEAGKEFLAKNTGLKKTLYKEKPIAQLQEVRKDGIVYAALCAGQVVKFIVPLDEVGEVIWEQSMDAKLLIRYLIENEN